MHAMDRIKFSVNGKKCSVGGEVDSDVSLNDYLRNFLNLRGTKYMCKEGGCGACIVTVTTRDKHGHPRTFSVNSCLVSVTSCHNWKVTTIEGIGDRRKGYHPLQKTLAEYNGTQCGHCSPGWIMNMFGLLESRHYDLTQYEIENSFGSNTCRCTGFRPILDAFKSFAKDAPKPNAYIDDIEDLIPCKGKKQCNKTCEKEWCFVDKSDVDTVIKIKLKNDHIWYRVTEIHHIFDILEAEGTDSYMLVNGNTGRGAVPILFFPKVLIDIRPVEELTEHYIDQNLVVGAGMTLTDLMELFKKVSKEHEQFGYLEKLYEHLDLVAHIPVRNIGSIAGNLMVKHRLHLFSSDIFLLFEAIGATLTIVTKNSFVEVYPEAFLSLDMTGKIIKQIKIPPLPHYCQFVSFKIMPRSQNVHATVNAAFLYEFDPHKQYEVVSSSRIVITGLSSTFVHAHKTEKYLIQKNIFTNEVLQEALKILEKELVVEDIPAELSAEYRKKCALGLFYKGLLTLIPKARLKPKYRSGEIDFRKTRPVSHGTEVYDTNPDLWPITEPMPKVEALIQCAGEAKYSNDLPTQPDEVFCAFVTSDVATGEILEIDATPALKIPGVLAFFSAKDIPGDNTYIHPIKVPGSGLGFEEIFADVRIKHYDQPIGIIVAETEKLANQAALLVRIKYKKDKEKPVFTIEEARTREPSRVTFFFGYPARDRGTDVTKVIKGSHKIEYQYHYTMETIACVTRPRDEGMDILAATQWPDLSHTTVASALNIEQNRIYLEVYRCGGAFGSRITRASQIVGACALATYLLDRPCRFVMSIQANMRCIGKRPPATHDFEAGVNSQGQIQYVEYHMYTDNGFIFNDPLLPFSSPAIKSCYDNNRWQYKGFNVTTDTASNTYCRAPGILEAISHTEYLMEHIAYEVNMDPLQVRLNNLSRQRTDVSEMVETLLKDSDYYKRKEEIKKFNQTNRWKKRGMGVALMSYPLSVSYESSVLLNVYHADGTVIICHAGIEIGQGINTRVIQTVAYALNISTKRVRVNTYDNVTAANAFTTGGSRAHEFVCFAAIKCCQLLLDRLGVVREEITDATFPTIIALAYNRGINLQTSYRSTANDHSTYRCGGVAFAEVQLDILTGEHDVLRVDLIQDCGLSVNPEIDIGQIEGSFIFGMGYFTCEKQIFDKDTGEILTDRSWYYHVPLAKDIPINFRVQIRRNSYNPLSVLGSKSVSEAPTCLSISVAFALRDAIASSREDRGIPRTEWFNVDGPYTLEANVLNSKARLDEFLFQ